MGKHEKGTPKEIANRCKSKGLQKLRWYCEMCQKQCRDQNGYKCHLTSESHQRQLLLVAENTEQYVKEFSKEFEDNFMHILKNSYGTRRVRANEVYQDYIKDKVHIHMNSTRWHSLSGFVQYLGNTGKCKIDKNEEKGWYIQYIDQEEVARKEEEARKHKAEKDDEDRQLRMINERVQRALEMQGDVEEYKATELVRGDEDEKITLNLNLNKKPTLEELNKPTTSLGVSVFDKLKNTKKEEPEEDRQRNSDYDRQRDRDREHRGERERERDVKRERRSRSRSNERRRGGDRDGRRDRDVKPAKRSALDEIREMNERKKEFHNRKDYWMRECIVVKIVTKKLGPNFYKRKGVVRNMIDDYTGSVELDDGTMVKLDQSHVETVIPSVGREMIIVNGAYRGQPAVLESLDESKFSLNLRISAGAMKGRTVQLPYEDASKLA